MRFTPQQQEIIDSPGKMLDLAEWILTSRRPSAAQREALEAAGLREQQREPNEITTMYFRSCLKGREKLVSDTTLSQLVDEYLQRNSS